MYFTGRIRFYSHPGIRTPIAGYLRERRYANEVQEEQALCYRFCSENEFPLCATHFEMWFWLQRVQMVRLMHLHLGDMSRRSVTANIAGHAGPFGIALPLRSCVADSLSLERLWPGIGAKTGNTRGSAFGAIQAKCAGIL